MRCKTLLLAACSLIPGIASADTVTAGPTPYSVTLPNLSAGTFSTSRNVTLAQFNPTLGTLNSILLTFNTGSSSYTLVARGRKTQGQDPTSVTATASNLNLVVDFPGVTPDLTFSLGGPFTAGCSIAGPAGLCLSPTAIVAGPTPSGSSNLALDPVFIGTGNWTASVKLFQTLSVTSSNNVNMQDFGSTLSTSWNGNLTVTYDYTPASTSVPEPSEYALAASAVGLAVTAFRRRRRS
ncbi:hypothetical protein F183_A14130 [Bryobacterales bacterium F-183]|nr:hypothetical protein F183_A14130 [Bryobacterales bacterium F-183]